ncbi:HAD family hydrolase [Murimonas intestini]|uniref:HAD family phosphatase n=1 Tax=Murimonas intestini TaxID=1337051 RepID=A0AB73T7G7_9FIRM|nr:HAD family hydrolase [Murimonas intestini]MCR1841185.1 HAD family hydrolase [Murimonas intestini]MCR1866103.1 HAD family hydrolase [Murimonas intestini]MCR1882780.1 HAD family hydrolase [Murimonas intestini]
MIKLIASDIDGTLLPEGTDRINREIFDVILKLKEQGIMFAAASGRQYNSIYELFQPVAHEMIFICENGAYVNCRGYQMSASVMDRQMTEDVIRYIRGLDGCFLTASCTDAMYIETADEKFGRLLTEGYHNKIKIVEDVLAEDLDIIKMSIYKETGIHDIAEETIKRWGDKMHVTVAGDIWIDFMDKKTDKGNAIKTIQEVMHILPEETMVFGDNHNDLGMMKRAVESYAVANAQPAVIEAANNLADKNVNDGVLKVLKTLLGE